MNPICLPEELGFCVSFLNSSNTTLKYWSCVESFLITAANLRFSSSFVSSICLGRTKARMIAMLTSIACSLFNTLESIATPCSVNAYGRYRRPPRPMFEIANCDLKDSVSSLVRRNMKSSGNRFLLRETCSFNRVVDTPVQLREIEVNHHLLTSNQVDTTLDEFDRYGKTSPCESIFVRHARTIPQLTRGI